MDQLKKLEALAESARRLDDKDLVDFLAALRTAEKTLHDILRERQDWREFRQSFPDLV